MLAESTRLGVRPLQMRQHRDRMQWRIHWEHVDLDLDLDLDLNDKQRHSVFWVG
jgi:hypothetical protein